MSFQNNILMFDWEHKFPIPDLNIKTNVADFGHNKHLNLGFWKSDEPSE